MKSLLAVVSLGLVLMTAAFAQEQKPAAPDQKAAAVSTARFDSDNDSAFINETVLEYCRQHGATALSKE